MSGRRDFVADMRALLGADGAAHCDDEAACPRECVDVMRHATTMRDAVVGLHRSFRLCAAVVLGAFG